LLGVIEHGGFIRAAEAMHVTQSALTKSVQSLEAYLGVRLLERNQRGVTLTDDGEWFIVRARQLIADAEQIESDVKALRQLKKGRLRIAAAPAAFDWVWMRAIPRFTEKFPLIRIETISEPVEHVHRLLADGRLDLAIGVLAQLRNDADLEVVDLADFSLEVFVRRGHPLDRDEQPSVEELLQYPMAGPTRAEPYSSAITGLSQVKGRYDLPHFVTDSVALMLRIVETTDAFSLVIDQRSHTPEFQRKFRSWPSYSAIPTLAISYARRKAMPPSPATAEFLKICEALWARSEQPPKGR
jgi:DNA-binding transcriptional LysR family regulator